MQIVHNKAEIQDWSLKFKQNNPTKKLSFVPTMGCLHDGHIALIQKAHTLSKTVVVSIFVNPLQFNNPNDFNTYPKTLDNDIQKLKENNVTILFLPKQIKNIYLHYPPLVQIAIPSLSQLLCGKSRPQHFEGVLLIVHHLFMLIQPDYAIFGLKDYQQYFIIKKMVEELYFNLQIVPVKTIRETDGLAMSSRNKNLIPKHREQATQLYQTLELVKKIWYEKRSISQVKNILNTSLEGIHLDYANVYDALTLQVIQEDLGVQKVLVAIAAYFGDVRLIDNILLD